MDGKTEGRKDGEATTKSLRFSSKRGGGQKRVIGTVGVTNDYAHWFFYLLLQHWVTALFCFPYTFIFFCLYLPVGLSICLSVCLVVCLSICLSIYSEPL